MATEVEDWQREENIKEEANIIEILKKEGIEVTELDTEEKDEFRDLFEDIYTKYGE